MKLELCKDGMLHEELVRYEMQILELHREYEQSNDYYKDLKREYDHYRLNSLQSGIPKQIFKYYTTNYVQEILSIQEDLRELHELYELARCNLLNVKDQILIEKRKEQKRSKDGGISMQRKRRNYPIDSLLMLSIPVKYQTSATITSSVVDNELVVGIEENTGSNGGTEVQSDDSSDHEDAW